MCVQGFTGRSTFTFILDDYSSPHKSRNQKVRDLSHQNVSHHGGGREENWSTEMRLKKSSSVKTEKWLNVRFTNIHRGTDKPNLTSSPSESKVLNISKESEQKTNKQTKSIAKIAWWNDVGDGKITERQEDSFWEKWVSQREVWCYVGGAPSV